MKEIFQLRREFDEYTKQQGPLFSDLAGMERFVKVLTKKAVKCKKHKAYLKICEVEFNMANSVNREDDMEVINRFSNVL